MRLIVDEYVIDHRTWKEVVVRSFAAEGLTLNECFENAYSFEKKKGRYSHIRIHGKGMMGKYSLYKGGGIPIDLRNLQKRIALINGAA